MIAQAILSAIAFLASAIVLVTIVARGADHPIHPAKHGLMPTLRLHAEKLALLLVGSSSGAVMLGVLGGLHPPPSVVALMAGTALWMLSHPAGWLAYVTRGRPQSCDELRPDP